MHHHEKAYPEFNRRAFILGGGSVVASLILLGRLYHLQFLQGDRYTTLAEGNRIKLHLTPPLRGAILDRNGLQLASNQQSYRLLLRTDQSPDIAKTLNDIHALVALDETVMETVRRTRKSHRYAPPVLLKEFLSWDEVARIEFHSASIPGVVIEVGQTRHYPYGEAIAHLLGYVGGLTEQDLEDRDLLKLPNFKVG
ncbi:MAG: hypothetical protein ACPG80_00030, partial [Rickettsiales bacterium]